MHQSDERVDLPYAVLLYNPNKKTFCICDARGENPALNDREAFPCRVGYTMCDRICRQIVDKAMKPKSKDFYENSLEKALEIFWTLTFSGIRNYPLRVGFGGDSAFYIEMRTAMEEKFPAVTKGGFFCGRRMCLPRLATETLSEEVHEALLEKFLSKEAPKYGWVTDTALADDYCRPSKYHNVYNVRKFMLEEVNDGKYVSSLPKSRVMDGVQVDGLSEIGSRLMLSNLVPMLLNRIRELEGKNA